MKAMIMAAGRGERMKPLTDTTPKPLLCVKGKALLQYHIEALVRAGITEIVINAAWLSQQIVAFVGDGSQFGAVIQVSIESQALESGGGLVQALPLLGEQPFIVVNGDVFTDYDYQQLLHVDLGDDLAYLVMVPNPEHNATGDFSLNDSRVTLASDPTALTFSGIRIFSPQLLDGCRLEYFSIVPRLKQAIEQNNVGGECYTGIWVDVGTPARLDALQ